MRVLVHTASPGVTVLILCHAQTHYFPRKCVRSQGLCFLIQAAKVLREGHADFSSRLQHTVRPLWHLEVEPYEVEPCFMANTLSRVRRTARDDTAFLWILAGRLAGDV